MTHVSEAEFHNWLEVHETYDIDFKAGVAVYSGAVALCHACHQFIHSGRLLAVLEKGEISRGKGVPDCGPGAGFDVPAWCNTHMSASSLLSTTWASAGRTTMT